MIESAGNQFHFHCYDKKFLLKCHVFQIFRLQKKEKDNNRQKHFNFIIDYFQRFLK